MEPGPRALLTTALWMVGAALCGRELGILAAALVCLLALSCTLVRGRCGPWLGAIPAALATALPPPLPCWPEPGPVRLQGHVLPGIHVDRGRRQMSFRLQTHQDQVLLCAVSGWIRVLPGDRVSGLVRLPPQPLRRRLGKMPRVVAAPDALEVEPGPPAASRLAEACRLALQESLLRAVPGDPGKLLCHLILGRGPPVAEDLVDAHRATGTSHLLAVSGAHLTMLGWLLGVLYRLLAGRSPLSSRTYRRGCALLLLLYGAITGFEPPVSRALVALLVVLWAYSRGRRVPLVAVLALPAMVTAVLSPRDLFGVSFNLSYAAVAGLALGGVFGGGSWLQRYLRAPLLGSCWACLSTMPLTLWYFGRYAPWTVLATPLLSPLVALMLGLGLLVALIGLCAPKLAALLGLPLYALTWLYSELVRGFACLPLAPVFAGTRPSWLLLAAMGGVGLLWLLYRRDRWGVAGLCLALSLPHFLPLPAKADVGLQLLAVGHGQACLLRLPGEKRILSDCGSLGDSRRAARATAEALLPERSLDWLVLSHRDFDHVGSVPSLLDRVRVLQALLPTEMRQSLAAAQLWDQGARLRFLAEGETLSLLPGLVASRPTVDSPDHNDHSIWLRVEFESCSALLCGDAMERGVQAWLRSEQARPADLLVLPHHGHEHQAAAELLRFVEPKLAMASSAESDGITPQGKIARDLGIRVLHTGIEGSIHVHASAEPTIQTQWPLQLK